MILNLTQHLGTPEQGVVEPSDKEKVSKLLTFEEIPTNEEMVARAQALVAIARNAGAESVMIGGAPFFMAPLEAAIAKEGMIALYAFSRRESLEEKLPDGSVRKTQVFRHVGFVPATTHRMYAYEDNAGGARLMWFASCLSWID